MEVYKVCFEKYEVSNMGNCRKMLNNGNYKKINGSVNNKGYLYFQVQRNGKRKNKLIHHLIAQQFINERPPGLVIDHIDRNKLNNKVENLRYITQKENCRNTNRYLTDLINKDDSKKRAVERTGLLGPIQFLIDSARSEKYGSGPIEALLGPIVSRLVSYMEGIRDIFTDGEKEKMIREIIKSIPGVSYLPQVKEYLYEKFDVPIKRG